MVLGELLLDLLGPVLELLAPYMPGRWFPLYFSRVYLQRPLIAALVVSMVAGFLGSFLLIRNLALIGDGLAHVSFGAIGIFLVIGMIQPVDGAYLVCILAAILIDLAQRHGWLTGDTAIGIISTGMLGLGLGLFRLYGSDSLTTIDSYLWGDLNIMPNSLYNEIIFIAVICYFGLIIFYRSLLAICIDPVAAKIQGIPVELISFCWSILVGLVVVSMVQIIGAILVTAMLVTPAAMAQLTSRSFLSTVILAQVYGVITVLLGLYYSAELGTGSGSMIALVSAILFIVVASAKGLFNFFKAINQDTI